jgi:hypothetical protein
MRDPVFHVPTGQRIDLAEPGDDGWELLRSIAPPDHVIHHGDLLCELHRSDLYLAHRGRHGELCGCHTVGGQIHYIPAPMSDEHKREVESWASQPDREGYSVEAEKRLHTGSRPDLVLDHRVPIEVQRSKIKVQAARSRTGKAMAAGLLPSTWSADFPFVSIGKKRQPLWQFQVPSVGMEVLPWDMVHDPHNVRIMTGLRKIVSARCDGTRDCLAGRRYPCGRQHPWHEPVQLSLAEVSLRLILGTIVPLRFQFTKSDAIYLTNPNGLLLYQELTGHPVEPLDFGIEEARQQPELGRIPCVADLPIPGPAHCAVCGRDLYHYSAEPDRFLCGDCLAKYGHLALQVGLPTFWPEKRTEPVVSLGRRPGAAWQVR